MVLTLRRLLFAAGFFLGVLFMGVVAVLIAQWLSYEKRAGCLLAWNRWTLWWAKVSCGVYWQVDGLDNIPNGPSVFLSNHESEGETYYLQLLLSPVSSVIKEELLKIPFFGLGLRLMKAIAINRGSPKESMRQLLAEGQSRLDEGLNVLIYPQGSRVNPTSKPLKYARGGAAIACNTGVAVVPIVHNASDVWADRGFNLKPGTITVKIGQPISTADKTPKEITQQVVEWTTQQRALLSQA